MEDNKAQQPKAEEAAAETAARSLENFVYINTSYVTSSNWDVRIILCERVPSDKVIPRVGVVMSHQHAKALLDALSTNLNRLEASMGPISWKPKENAGGSETKH